MSANFDVSAERIADLVLGRVYNNPFIPNIPTPKQTLFLQLDDKEALFGGAVGGGKSDALLMASLMFVTEPGYNAILFRKTFADLALPDAIMARSHEWLRGTDASWNGTDYRWTFPSRSTLSFGYLRNEDDKYRYQSAAFQYIGFDELTQHEIAPYLYMFSRMRRGVGVEIPIRMRGATNPGGIGHEWVYERFIIEGSKAPFVPSLLEDNPYLDQEEYEESLENLDETTRKQLRSGLWVVHQDTKTFDLKWWRGRNRFLVDAKKQTIARFQSWDLALTDKDTSSDNACVTFEIMADYTFRVVDVFSKKMNFPETLNTVYEMARRWNYDGRLSTIIIEAKASGLPVIQSIRTSYDVATADKIVAYNPTESKEIRAAQAGLWCKRGLIHLPFPHEDTEWLNDFEQALNLFPLTSMMDAIDAFSQGVLYFVNYLVLAWQGKMAEERARDPKPMSRVAKAIAEHEGAKKKTRETRY